MDKRLLIMKWDYKYDKESTWFDEDHGENEYELIEGASYKLPHISDKSLEIWLPVTLFPKLYVWSL